jgi:hypothetical protein
MRRVIRRNKVGAILKAAELTIAASAFRRMDYTSGQFPWSMPFLYFDP